VTSYINEQYDSCVIDVEAGLVVAGAQFGRGRIVGVGRPGPALVDDVFVGGVGSRITGNEQSMQAQSLAGGAVVASYKDRLSWGSQVEG